MSNNIVVRGEYADSAVCLLTVIGGVLLFGAAAYRIFVRPELSAIEAFALLWPYFVAGAIAIALGLRIDRLQDDEQERRNNRALRQPSRC